MPTPPTHQDVEVTDEGRTVAVAHVCTSPDTPGTVSASFRAEAGHIPAGARAHLVDAVLDLPEMQDGAQLEATVPLGDAETLERLRLRTSTMTTHAAGCSALVDAQLAFPVDAPPADDST